MYFAVIWLQLSPFCRWENWCHFCQRWSLTMFTDQSHLCTDFIGETFQCNKKELLPLSLLSHKSHSISVMRMHQIKQRYAIQCFRWHWYFWPPYSEERKREGKEREKRGRKIPQLALWLHNRWVSSKECHPAYGWPECEATLQNKIRCEKLRSKSLSKKNILKNSIVSSNEVAFFSPRYCQC